MHESSRCSVFSPTLGKYPEFIKKKNSQELMLRQLTTQVLKKCVKIFDRQFAKEDIVLREISD